VGGSRGADRLGVDGRHALGEGRGRDRESPPGRLDASPRIDLVDPLIGFDWARHWRDLVERRVEQTGGPLQTDFWTRRAGSYAVAPAEPAPPPDPVLSLLEPWLSPQRSLLDVGAGVGRHTVPLAERLAWVTAIEPSQAMRQRIPELANVTVIASTLEEAEPAPSELVLCSHVLYPIADAVGFLTGLEAAATERVFVILRDAPNPHPAELIAGPERVREPCLRDLFMLLRQIGVTPEVSFWSQRGEQRWPNLEAALEDCRGRAGARWDEVRGREFLERELIRGEPDEGVLYRSPPYPVGAVHWRPRT